MKSLIIDLTVMTVIVCIVVIILLITVFPIGEIRGNAMPSCHLVNEQAPVPPQAPPIPGDNKPTIPISDGVHEWRAYSDGDTTCIMLMKKRDDRTLYQVGVYVFLERKYYRIISHYPKKFQEESPPILPPNGPVHNHRIETLPNYQRTSMIEASRQYYSPPILQRSYGGYGSYGANCGPRG